MNKQKSAFSNKKKNNSEGKNLYEHGSLLYPKQYKITLIAAEININKIIYLIFNLNKNGAIK